MSEPTRLEVANPYKEYSEDRTRPISHEDEQLVNFLNKKLALQFALKNKNAESRKSAEISKSQEKKFEKFELTLKTLHAPERAKLPKPVKKIVDDNKVIKEPSPEKATASSFNPIS